MHYAGLRLRYPINSKEYNDEFVVFQGASYFRGVGKGLVYGLSARGLAIGTGEPEGEEFPFFRAHWIEARPTATHGGALAARRPERDRRLSLHHPARRRHQIDVEATIFARQEIAHLGLAPLTSMFLFDAKDRGEHDDFRLGVHDSDGLAMLERLGRAAVAAAAHAEAAADQRLLGLRPARLRPDPARAAIRGVRGPECPLRAPALSLGRADRRLGQGPCRARRDPDHEEVHDNIVAYWRPGDPSPAGSERFSLTYRLHWG